MKEDKHNNKPTIWQVALSIMAAAFGVQSKRNQERDFTHGNITVYIVAGVLFTLLFIGGISFVVAQVLTHYGL